MILDLTDRHPDTQNLMKWLTPNSKIPAHALAIPAGIYALAREMVIQCADGPELSEGLRKLLEAKDCLVRARLDTPEAQS